MFRIYGLIVLLFLVASTGCSQGGDETGTLSKPEATSRDDSQPAGGTSYDEVYAAAQEALAEATAARNVWSKTDALLERSKVAHEEGRLEEAIALASEAKLQAELALEQARAEQTAWRTRVLSE